VATDSTKLKLGSELTYSEGDALIKLLVPKLIVETDLVEPKQFLLQIQLSFSLLIKTKTARVWWT